MEGEWREVEEEEEVEDEEVVAASCCFRPGCEPRAPGGLWRPPFVRQIIT